MCSSTRVRRSSLGDVLTHQVLQPVSERPRTPPRLRNPLQLVSAAVFERDSGTGDEILDGAGDEHLAGPGERCDTRADVDGDAADLLVDKLALAGVQPGAHVEVEVPDPVAHCTGTANGARRPVEARKEPVAGRIDLPPAKASELGADDVMVLLQQDAPAAVAERSRPGGRVDDVREENRRQDAVRLDLPRFAFGDLVEKALELCQQRLWLAELGREVLPRQLHEPGMCSARYRELRIWGPNFTSVRPSTSVGTRIKGNTSQTSTSRFIRR